MADISVNEYVRTKVGLLGKVLKITNFKDEEENIYEIDMQGKELYVKGNYEITKHSFNLIDLIEVKDILRIIMCDAEDIDKENPYETLWYIDTSYTLNNITALIKANEVSLLGIVTKEQFKSMEYKVGGEDEQSR